METPQEKNRRVALEWYHANKGHCAARHKRWRHTPAGRAKLLAAVARYYRRRKQARTPQQTQFKL